MSEAEITSTTAETSELTARFRVGVFAWPSLRREIEHACIAAGITRRTLKAKWRGLAVDVEVALTGERASVKRLARFIDDVTAQRA